MVLTFHVIRFQLSEPLPLDPVLVLKTVSRHLMLPKEKMSCQKPH